MPLFLALRGRRGRPPGRVAVPLLPELWSSERHPSRYLPKHPQQPQRCPAVARGVRTAELTLLSTCMRKAPDLNKGNIHETADLRTRPVRYSFAMAHDLENLVRQATATMAAEYERMSRLAKDDPGTAGDQGEENWAELLRQWLPAIFPVRTKGRIVFPSGQTSGQVDVVILSPYYPQGLLSNKLFIAGGVLAAFECKRTLKREHIRKAVQAKVKLGGLIRSNRQVSRPIIFGVLAHSHNIAGKKISSVANLEEALVQADQEEVRQPARLSRLDMRFQSSGLGLCLGMSSNRMKSVIS